MQNNKAQIVSEIGQEKFDEEMDLLNKLNEQEALKGEF